MNHAAMKIRILDTAHDHLVVADVGNALGIHVLRDSRRDLAREEVERRVLAGVADTHVEAADRHEAACVRPLTARVEHLDEHGIANADGLAAVPNSSLILRAREMANAEAAELVGCELDLIADGEVRAIAVHGADPKHDR
jgi:hypothetical protein